MNRNFGYTYLEVIGMKVKFRMLYEKIPAFIPDAKINILGSVDLDAIICGARMFSPLDSHPQPQYIYFCSANDVEKLTDAYEDVILVCVSEKEELPEFLGDSFKIVMIMTAMQMSQVFNLLSEIIMVAYNINMIIQENALGKRELRDLLVLGEGILTNVYVLFDSCFELVGYSERKVSNNLFYKNIIETNALEPRKIMQLIDNGIFVRLQKCGEVLLPEHNFLTDVPVFIKEISERGTVLGYGFLICVNTLPLKDMMRFFAEYIDSFRKYLSSAGEPKQLFLNNQCEAFLIGLVQHNFSDEDQIRNISRSFHIDPDEECYLIRIQYKEGERIPNGYARKELENLLNEHVAFFYQQGLQVLIKRKQWIYHIDDECERDFSDYLKKYNAVCGVSNLYSGVQYLDKAFRQVMTAIELGQQFSTVRTKTYYNYNDKLFPYYNYEILDMIHCYYQWHHYLPGGLLQLKKLLHVDKMKHTDYMKTLFVYMEKGYSINKAAAAMYMHRNSLIYRLEAIEEIMEVDFKEATYKELLPLSYRILDYEIAYLNFSEEK